MTPADRPAATARPAAVDAVVFDIGNVLIRWDVRALFRTIFSDPEEMERFLAEVWTPMENERCDRGEPFAVVIEETVADHPEHEEAIRASWDRWIETIPGPVEGSLELLTELRDLGVPRHALSNFSAETFPLVRDRYPHFALLDEIVISGDTPGLAKPDRRMFEELERRTGIDRDRTVFVDDSPLNTSAAARYGYRTVTFTDTPTLRAALRSLGIDVVSA